jgi:ubiquinone/menaquinone biosynthesis C-methylase UbiE
MMKTRESGMPEEAMWSSFFSPEEMLDRLRLTPVCESVVDFGCGYGTFTIPTARIVRGMVHALDIDPDMVRETAQKAMAAGLTNVRTEHRDFVAQGTGLSDASVGYVMLFNILHCEEPMVLLREAWRNLKPGGFLGIIHWNYDSRTPRGPSMEIRPRPEQCRAWAEKARFVTLGSPTIDLPPHHYGMVLRKQDFPHSS